MRSHLPSPLSLLLTLLVSVSFLSIHGIAALNIFEKKKIMMQGRSKRNVFRDRHRPTQKDRRRGSGWIGREISLCETIYNTDTHRTIARKEAGKERREPLRWRGDRLKTETRAQSHNTICAWSPCKAWTKKRPNTQIKNKREAREKIKTSSTIEKLLLYLWEPSSQHHLTYAHRHA